MTTKAEEATLNFKVSREFVARVDGAHYILPDGRLVQLHIVTDGDPYLWAIARTLTLRQRIAWALTGRLPIEP